MAISLAESGTSYYLTARCERPIEGCELAPNAFLQLKGGVMDNSTRAKLLESNPYEYKFRWSRSAPLSRICAYEECPLAGSFNPSHWSKTSLGGPSLLCNICFKYGKYSREASFCSARCLKNAWKEHSKVHAELIKSVRLNKRRSETDEGEDSSISAAVAAAAVAAAAPNTSYNNGRTGTNINNGHTEPMEVMIGKLSVLIAYTHQRLQTYAVDCG